MTSTSTDRRQGLNSGAALKVPCRAASTGNLTLSGEQTIDGVACVTGDRVLVKDQTDGTENGIYVVDSGVWDRDKDFDGYYDVVSGTLASVTEGTVNPDSMWRVANTGTITPGTTAIVFENAAFSASTSVSFIQAGAAAVSRTAQSKMRDIVSVFDFMTVAQIAAVQNNTVLDVTTPVQAAIDYIETIRQGHLYFPPGDYRVTKITLGRLGTRLGATYDFGNATIVGIAAVAKTACVEIKCGSAYIFNLKVASANNEFYESGIHWYTNDTNTWYPGYNQIHGLHASGFLIGLCIGALPSQADPIPAQGVVVADGLATDAPLSECYISGMQFTYCIKDVYARQPNGKLTFVNPTLASTNASWPGSGASDEANVVTLTNIRSELTLLGGSLENIDDAAGALGYLKDSTTNIIGAVLESKCAIQIEGYASVRMSHILNWGLNDATKRFFDILDTADGSLDLSDTWLLRGFAYATAQPLIKVVSAFSTGSSSANGKFWVNCSQTRFGDPNFTQGATYNPLVFGCRTKFSNCWMTNYDGSGNRLSAYKVDEGPNLLMGKVDLPADVITAYGVNAGATSGGWVFSNAAGTSSWGRTATSLPTIEGVTANNALRLTAAGGGATVSGLSPKFNVEPQRLYLVKGWMKTSGLGSTNIIRMNWYDFSGAAASTASTDLYSGQQGPAGTVWVPFMLWAQAPKDATQAELFVYSENGAEQWTVNLEVR